MKEIDDEIEELCSIVDLSDEEEKKEPFTYTTKSGEEISSAATPLNPNLYTGIDVNSIGTSLCHLKTKPENPIAKRHHPPPRLLLENFLLSLNSLQRNPSTKH